MNTRNERGFTIIELVVVIAILGILAAVAMPKFAGLEVKARTAAFEGVKGGFTAGVQIAHSKWLVENEPAIIVMDGPTNICMSATGWPQLDPNTGCSTQGTADGLYALLMSGATPNNWTTGGTPPTDARFCLTGSGGNNFLYTVAGGTVANDPNNTCP